MIIYTFAQKKTFQVIIILQKPWRNITGTEGYTCKPLTKAEFTGNTNLVSICTNNLCYLIIISRFIYFNNEYPILNIQYSSKTRINVLNYHDLPFQINTKLIEYG